MAQVVLKCQQNQTGGGGGGGGIDLPDGYKIDEDGNFYKDNTLFLFRDFGESLNSLGSEYKQVVVYTQHDENTYKFTTWVECYKIHHYVFRTLYPAWSEVFKEKYLDRYSDGTWRAADNMVARLVSKNPLVYTNPEHPIEPHYGWGGGSSDWLTVSVGKFLGAESGIPAHHIPYDILPSYVGHTATSNDSEFNTFATGLCWGIDRTTNWTRIRHEKRIRQDQGD